MKAVALFFTLIVFNFSAQARVVIEDTDGQTVSPASLSIYVDKDGLSLLTKDKSYDLSGESLKKIGYTAGEFQALILQAKTSENVDAIISIKDVASITPMPAGIKPALTVSVSEIALSINMK